MPIYRYGPRSERFRWYCQRCNEWFATERECLEHPWCNKHTAPTEHPVPNRPRKPCQHPGCPNIGGCPQHGDYTRRAYDKARGTAAQRGYNSAWSRFAKVYRTNHPLCAACERQGRPELAKQVDHIIPLSVWNGTKYDESNLQGLCRPCHTQKTNAEANDKSGRGYLAGGTTPLVPKVLPVNPTPHAEQLAVTA